MSKEASAAISTGAAAAGTAAAGPIGAAVGEAVGGFIASLFGKKPSMWDAAGPGVHAWFTTHGPEKFLQWMKAKHPTQFGSLDEVKALYPVWLWEYNRSILNPDETNFVSSKINEVYAAMGIDYPATIARMKTHGRGYTAAGTVTPENIIMLPGGGTPQVPAVAVAQIKAIEDKKATGASLTANEAAISKGIAKAAEGSAGGGVSIGWETMLLLAVLVYFLFRKG